MADRPAHGPLPAVLLLLTALSGVVDAVSYLRLGHVFVANMTGNVVFLGFAAAGAAGTSAPGSLIALGAFFAGSIAGGRIAWLARAHRGVVLALACATSALVIAAGAALAFAAGTAPWPAPWLVALLSCAMGVQSAAARRVGVPDLNTTVVTMTLVALASETGVLKGATQRLGLRSAAIAAMLAGAFFGALLLARAGLGGSLVAAAALAAVAAGAIAAVSKRSAAWAN